MGIMSGVLLTSFCMAVASFQSAIDSWKDHFNFFEEERVATLKNGLAMLITHSQFSDQKASIRVIMDESSSMNGDKDDAGMTISFLPVAEGETIDDVEKDHPQIISWDFSCDDGTFQQECEKFLEVCQLKIQELKAKNLSPRAVVVVGNLPREEFVTHFFEDLTLPSEEADLLSGYSCDKRPVLVEVNYFSVPTCATLPIPDLQQAWMQNFLQSLLIKRMENSTLNSKFLWEKNFPSHPNCHCSIYALTTEDESLNALNTLILELENVGKEGFSRAEFDICKKEWEEKLFNLASSLAHFDNSVLADFYAYQLLNKQGFSPISNFLQTSWDFLDDVNYDVFSLYLSAFLNENNRHIHVSSFPCNKNAVNNQKDDFGDFEDSLIGGSRFSLTPIRLASTHFQGEERDLSRFNLERNEFSHEMPSIADSEVLFAQLPISDNQKKIIEYIVTTMAKKNVLQLGLMRKSMERKGDKIYSVHPLKFLQHVFSNQDLKNAMHKIRKSGFKWDGFINGYSKKMKEEARKNHLVPYVPAFAKSLNVREEHVMRYITNRDYEGLVKFLMHS